VGVPDEALQLGCQHLAQPEARLPRQKGDARADANADRHAGQRALPAHLAGVELREAE
jgi:hypothetical protein